MKRTMTGLTGSLLLLGGVCSGSLVLVIIIASLVLQTFLSAIAQAIVAPTIPPTIHGVPTSGVITATFRDAVYFQLFGWEHLGLDLANQTQPPITSTVEAATVVQVGYQAAGWGHYVILEDNAHPGWQVIYAHLESIAPAILEGRADVVWGETLGVMGSSGNSTGIHLHYEIHAPSGVPVDPESSLNCCGSVAEKTHDQ